MVFNDGYAAARDEYEQFEQCKQAVGETKQAIREALTALEEKVEELEKERILIIKWYDDTPGEYEALIQQLQKEAPDATE